MRGVVRSAWWARFAGPTPGRLRGRSKIRKFQCSVLSELRRLGQQFSVEQARLFKLPWVCRLMGTGIRAAAAAGAAEFWMEIT